MEKHEGTEPVKHKRRARYQGTHPRRFDEKYKELNPEKYPDAVEKVIESGKTPAGMHRPVCVDEVVEILKPSCGQVGLDATLGFGGHAQVLLEAIKPKGCLYAMDADPLEIKRTTERLRALGYDEKSLVTVHSNFAGAVKLLSQVKKGFDFILADLGVSSMQLDNPARGFTFKSEGPLDLRLNPQRGQPAAVLIKKIDEKKLEALLRENSDEPCAQPIARAVFAQRNKINTTTELAQAIAYALGAKSSKESSSAITDSIRRTFQALRIEVNEEFCALEQFLRSLPLCLKPGGRAAILTFHSGEEKRVRRYFHDGLYLGTYSDICKKPIRPGAKERFSNPRCKSAALWWAQK